MTSPTLNSLFLRLQTTTDPQVIDRLQDEILAEWLESGNPMIDQIMREGIHAIEQDAYTDAVQWFTEAIILRPDFAEAWSKRATAFFLRGSFKQALIDLEQTIWLEPRHFGAYAGMVAIYLTVGDYPKALESVELLLSLVPYDDGARDQQETLKIVLGA